jgi:hypothetical protein
MKVLCAMGLKPVCWAAQMMERQSFHGRECEWQRYVGLDLGGQLWLGFMIK